MAVTIVWIYAIRLEMFLNVGIKSEAVTVLPSLILYISKAALSEDFDVVCDADPKSLKNI